MQTQRNLIQRTSERVFHANNHHTVSCENSWFGVKRALLTKSRGYLLCLWESEKIEIVEISKSLSETVLSVREGSWSRTFGLSRKRLQEFSLLCSAPCNQLCLGNDSLMNVTNQTLVKPGGKERYDSAERSVESRPDDQSWKLRRVDSLSATEFEALEWLAYEYGESPESYLAIEPERYCILSPDHSAAISVIPSGRFLHCSGGILASAEKRSQFIHRLTEWAKGNRRVLACYSIGEQDRPHFEEAGWEVSKFGEDTLLKLDSLNWSGKPYEWVRRQSNYCQRMGLVTRELHPHLMDDLTWRKIKEELFEVLRDDLKDRIYDREINLLVGKLQPDNLGRRRLFIAENSTTGRIEAFIIGNPMRGGDSLALEMFRKRSDATRGAIPFLIKDVLDQLRSEGVKQASLSLLIWKGSRDYVGNRTSTVLRFGLFAGEHLGNLLYRTEGLTHFKTRFRPELSNCYLCVSAQTTIMSVLSFMYTIGAFQFSIRNAIKPVFRVMSRKKSS